MLDLQKNNLQEIITNNNICVIDFYSTYCVPCKTVEKDLLELEPDYKNKIFFAKINIENFNDLSAELHILSVPTLLIFKERKEVQRLTGNINKKKLTQILDELIK